MIKNNSELLIIDRIHVKDACLVNRTLSDIVLE